MNKKNFFSWLIMAIAVWLIIGIILYPSWYYELFYRGGFWRVEFWFGGIRSIFHYLFFYNPLLFIGIIALYFFVQKKIIDFKLPELDFFSSLNKASIILILSIIVGIVIWGISLNREFDYNSIYSYNSQVMADKQEKISIPLDFIYINKDRVDNLFEQIKPELILKEKQLESQTEDGKEISNGDNPVLNAKRLEKNSNKQIDTYSATETSEPKKVTALLNHFYSLNAIKEFQTLEGSAEDVKKLEIFRTISQQFQIQYDKAKYAQVYNRVIGEALIKEHSTMKRLTGQVVIKGDFLVSQSSDKILLKHSYIEIDENNRITFNVSTLSKSEKISSAISEAGQNNKTMSLNIFGKVTRVESNDKVTDIYFDAYSIW